MTTKEPTVCPKCTATLITHPHYTIWCPTCDWNLAPGRPAAPTKRAHSFYRKTGQAAARALLDDFLRTGAQPTRIKVSTVLAWGLAGLVHLGSLTIAAAGVYLILSRPNHLLSIFGSVCCLGMAWLLRPIPSKMPKNVLPEAEYPTTYRVVNQVASALNYRPIRKVCVTSDYNASFAVAGWRREPLLRLGLPMLSVMDAGERIALLAHELAHGVNHDTLQGLFLGSAVESLFRWHALLKPDRLIELTESSSYLVTLAEILVTPIFRFFMLGLSFIPWSIAWLLLHLVWRESQRAEYRADLMAARVSGSSAAISSLEKTLLHTAYLLAVQRAAVGRGEGEFFQIFHEAVRDLPSLEIERLRRCNLLESDRWDVTHPPVSFTVELLRSIATSTPLVVLSAPDNEALDVELSKLKDTVHADLKDRYLASLA